VVNNAVQQRPAEPPARSTKSNEVRTITSEQLLGGGRVVVILHRREEYRLQVTATGKLILTK
jgi:hemin uptake protein HemP